MTSFFFFWKYFSFYRRYLSAFRIWYVFFFFFFFGEPMFFFCIIYHHHSLEWKLFSVTGFQSRTRIFLQTFILYTWRKMIQFFFYFIFVTDIAFAPLAYILTDSFHYSFTFVRYYVRRRRFPRLISLAIINIFRTVSVRSAYT